MSIRNLASRGTDRLDGLALRGALPGLEPAHDALRAGLDGGMVWLFCATAFVSAFLLFWVQPLIAKLLLPLLGGSPAVWNTAMMFFQLVLLAGYLYVHLLRRLAVWVQFAVHAALLGFCLLLLPFGTAAGLVPPSGGDGSPLLWLLGTLAALVGLPFFALSASAPLLQSWFGRSAHRHAADPYFLYAASNLGSFVSLLGFPLVLERELRLAEQGAAWAWLFAALFALVGACFGLLWLSGGRLARSAPVAAAEPDAAPRAAWGQRARWVALAFVPSSLLLGVTSYVATDLASVPLLWVLPLALYLLTFIIAFAGRPDGSRGGLMDRGLMVGLVMVTVLLACSRLLTLPLPAWVTVPGHIVGFFLIALGCHGWLARLRPSTARLTEFYLCLSIGGALGGVLNALIAPMVFTSTYEYEIGLALAGTLGLLVGVRTRLRVSDVLLPLLLFVGLLGMTILLKRDDWVTALGGWPPKALAALAFGAALLACGRRRPRFALAIAFGLGGGLLAQDVVSVVHEERSFFGVHRLRSVEDGRYLQLINGNTMHGGEATDPGHWRETSTYYGLTGPAGQFFTRLPAAPAAGARRVGVIGLGTGGLRCLGAEGEDWTFFEIDRAVIRLAGDTRYFHYLASCPGSTRIVQGDGRLQVAAMAEARFDVLVLDAFSSDSIPVHLLTREAMQLYLSKLAPHGRLLVHVSNRYLRLDPVVAAAVDSLGLASLEQLHLPDAGEQARWMVPSRWVAIGRDAADLAFLADDPHWTALPRTPGLQPWTDDFSNVLRAVEW